MTDDKEYAKYTKWGKTRQKMHKKNLVKIIYEKKKLKRKSDEEGRRKNGAFFPTVLLICSMYLIIDVLWKKKTLKRRGDGKSKKK